MTAVNELARQGSTKKIQVHSAGKLKMETTPFLSAFDVGPCSHRFPRIDIVRTTFTDHFFRMLSEAGVLHHFVKRNGMTSVVVKEFQVSKLNDDGSYELLPPLSDSVHGRQIPLEFIVRREVATTGLAKRIKDKNDPLTLQRLGVKSVKDLAVGKTIPLFVECSTKLEPKDRYLSDKEAMRLGGLSEEELSLCFTLMRKVAGILIARAKRNNMNLKDFKLELGITPGGEPVVTDFFSPDEMRLTNAKGESKDKDIFRGYLDEVGFKTLVDEARKNGTNLPQYPRIPEDISTSVASGYESACEQFWR